MTMAVKFVQCEKNNHSFLNKKSQLDQICGYWTKKVF